jgi:hypothetical protein
MTLPRLPAGQRPFVSAELTGAEGGLRQRIINCARELSRAVRAEFVERALDDS